MSRKQSDFGSGAAKPKNFPAREDVLVTRIGEGVISSPAITDVTKWFAEMDREGSGQFLTMGCIFSLRTPALRSRRTEEKGRINEAPALSISCTACLPD